MDSIYYVYKHIRKSDGKIFYIGKGKGQRAYCKHGRNCHWQRTVRKHGYHVEIVVDELHEELAFDVERFLIAQCKQEGCPLTNMTDGGEGASGTGRCIYCQELGRIFHNAMEAAMAVKFIRGEWGCERYIQVAAQGLRKQAYGLTFQYL